MCDKNMHYSTKQKYRQILPLSYGKFNYGYNESVLEK